jgi:hypothetical protein
LIIYTGARKTNLLFSNLFSINKQQLASILTTHWEKGGTKGPPHIRQFPFLSRTHHRTRPNKHALENKYLCQWHNLSLNSKRSYIIKAQREIPKNKKYKHPPLGHCDFHFSFSLSRSLDFEEGYRGVDDGRTTAGWGNPNAEKYAHIQLKRKFDHFSFYFRINSFCNN